MQDRLNTLRETMEKHDWYYQTRDDYGRWNRGHDNSDRIVRESMELRRLGLDDEVNALWAELCPYHKV